MATPDDAGTRTAMNLDHRRIGLGVAAVGLLLLLTLRLWASPVATTVTGRSRPGAAAFLAIPVVLLVVAAGIVVALWGEELGLG